MHKKPRSYSSQCTSVGNPIIPDLVMLRTYTLLANLSVTGLVPDRRLLLQNSSEWGERNPRIAFSVGACYSTNKSCSAPAFSLRSGEPEEKKGTQMKEAAPQIKGPALFEPSRPPDR
jgi:hypothetical protein